MEKKSLQIYYTDSSGNVKTFPEGMRPATITSYTFTAQRMGSAPQLTSGSMYYPSCLDDLWTGEEYVVFRGEKYFVDQVGSSSKGNDNLLYKHNLIFASERLILDCVYFYDVVVEERDTAYKDRVRSNGTKFSFYGDIHEFASRLTDSMIYRGLCKFSRDTDGNETYDGYHVVFDDETTVSDTEELSFDQKTLSEAIQEIYNTFELNYYFVGKTLHIGDQSRVIDTVFEYGRENGLLSFGRTNSNVKIVDRMTGYGSSDNLQSYYPNNSEYGNIFYDVNGFDKSEIKYLSYPKLIASGVDVDNGDTITYTSKACTIDITYKSLFAQVDPNPNSSHNLKLYQGDIEKEGAWYKVDGNVNFFGWCEVISAKVTIHAKGSGGIIDFSPYAYFGDKAGNADGGYIDVTTNTDEGSVTTRINVGNFAWTLKSISEIATTYKTQRALEFIPEESVNGLDATQYFTHKNWGEIVDSDAQTMRTPFGVYIIDSIDKLTFEDDSVRDITLELLFFASKRDNFPDTIIGYESNSWFQKFYFAHTYSMPASYYFEKEDGTHITYVNSGVRFDDNTAIPVGSTITFKGREFYPTCTSLMPAIYRDTKGKERFYEATNSPKERYTEIYDSYVDDGTIVIEDDNDKDEFEEKKEFAIGLYKEGDSYHHFSNPLNEKHPHEHIETFGEIRVGIENVTNYDGDHIGEIVAVGFDDDDNDEKNDDGSYLHPYFYIKLHRFDGELGFNLFSCASNTGKMQINMTSGTCAGCVFEVAAIKQSDASGSGYYTFKNGVQIDDDGNLAAGNMTSVDGTSGKWNSTNLIPEQQNTFIEEVWIAVKKDVDTYGVILPNQVNQYRPKAGDTFNITGINLPEQYIIAAERKLSEAIVEYIKDNNDYQFSPTLKFSQVYLQYHPDLEELIDENVSLKVKYNGHIFQYHVSSFTCKAENSSLCEITVDLVEDLEAQGGNLRSTVGQIAKEYFLSNSTLRAIANSISGNTLSEKDVLSIVGGNFLSKTGDDTATGVITFLKGLVLGTNGYKLDAEGNAFLKSLYLGLGTYGLYENGSGKLNILELVKAVISELATPDFKEGELGTGASIYKDGTDWVIETDRLLVRKIATFLELEIRKLSYTAGNVVIGAAGSRISSVEEVYDDDGNLIGWKCYYVQDDGTTATTNSWRVNDQARCQTFNTDAGTYTNAGNRYYWRLVTEVGTDYIVLSASIKDASTDNSNELCVPKVGDTLTLVGHQILRDSDTTLYKERTNLIMLSTNGTNVPSIVGYTAITDFDLTNAFETFTLSPEKVVFHSKYFSWDNTGVSWPTPKYRGDYDSTSTYDYGDEVTYDDCIWICLDSNGAAAGETPSESSSVWSLVSGKPGMSDRYFMQIDQSLGGTMAPNETETVTCTIYNGYNEDVTSQFTLFAVARDTGDESTDAVWNAAHTNVGNPFEIAFSDLGINGISKTVAKFYVTATDEATDAQSSADIDYTA